MALNVHRNHKTYSGAEVEVGDCFYIALFSALELTHCALVGCDSTAAVVLLNVLGCRLT